MVAPNPLWLPPIRYGCPTRYRIGGGWFFFSPGFTSMPLS